jgi:hypothetical protein
MERLTPITILCTRLSWIGTGELDYRPLMDLHVHPMRNLNAGEILGNDHSPDLHALIHLACAVRRGAPPPFHMGNGNRLCVDVPAVTLITVVMIDGVGQREWLAADGCMGG